MLTIEREICQIVDEIPNEIPEVIQKKITLHFSSNKTSKLHFGELLLIIGDVFNDLSSDIENNWEKYGDPKSINKYEKMLGILDVVSDQLKIGYGKREVERKESQGDINFKKGVTKIKKSINNLRKILNDTIQSIEIASQVRELRLKKLSQARIEEAREILSLL